MKTLLLTALLVAFLPLVALAGSTGTVIGGGSGGDVTGLPNPMDANLNANTFDITNVGTITADEVDSSAADGSRRLSLNENTTGNERTCSAVANRIEVYNNNNARYECDEDGDEVQLGYGRVLIGTDTEAGTQNQMQVDIADWQTIYSRIDVEVQDVYCATSVGVRFRINDNGVEAATPQTYNMTEHFDFNGGTPVVTDTAPTTLRTDTGFNPNAAAGDGVTGFFTYLSGGTSANSSFTVVHDLSWGQTSGTDGSWQNGNLASGQTPTTSFDGFIYDCAGANNITGTMRVYGWPIL